MSGKFQGYGERKGQKEGGIHKPDPDGGIYKLTRSDQSTDMFLIKRDGGKPQNDIAEYLASSIFDKTAPGHGAKIELVKNTSKEPDPQNKGNTNAFLASKYFKDYKDFFKEAGYRDRPEKLEATQSLLPGKGYVPQELTKKTGDGSYKYDGYEKSLVTSLLLGDFSVHSGNMGVIGKENDEKKKLVRIDFGAAFRDMQPDINPYKSVKNRIGLEKNYFLRDHPKERIESKEFATELRKVAGEDLTPTIEQKWNNIKNNFDEKAIKDFGKGLGVSEKDRNPDKIKEHFANTLKERQQSLKDIANEIDINIAIKTEGPKQLHEAIKKAVIESPNHFQKIVNNPKETQLQTNYSKETLQLIAKELESQKTKNLGLSPSSKPEEKETITQEVEQQERKEESKPEKKNVFAKAFDTVKEVVKEQISKRIIEPIKKEIKGIITEVKNQYNAVKATVTKTYGAVSQTVKTMRDKLTSFKTAPSNEASKGTVKSKDSIIHGGKLGTRGLIKAVKIEQQTQEKPAIPPKPKEGPHLQKIRAKLTRYHAQNKPKTHALPHKTDHLKNKQFNKGKGGDVSV